MPIENELASLIAELEQDHSLEEPRRLRERFEALDNLDVYLADGQSVEMALHRRAKAICDQLEAANLKLYESIRQDIQRGTGRKRLLEWMPDWNSAAHLTNQQGYDYLDDLISGILRFEEPSDATVQLESEMVPYQPTPARHVFDLIERTALTERDVFVDIGSGLGQVALMASICSGADCVGIEMEPSYVDCVRKSVQSLNLNNVRIIQGDVRAADLSFGTIFYLYTPFTGAILRDALNLLRREAATHAIRICTFGPCTQLVAEERWLNIVGTLETGRIAIFRSSD